LSAGKNMTTTNPANSIYSQPNIVRNHSKLVLSHQTPINGLYIATMAQVYPQDRGVSYAVKQGRYVGNMVADNLV
jgi:hypothetical protein